jgi:hypothetical protein
MVAWCWFFGSIVAFPVALILRACIFFFRAVVGAGLVIPGCCIHHNFYLVAGSSANGF